MVAPGLSQVGGLTVYAFSPSQFDVFAQPVSGGFVPVAPSDILAASGAVAALNGPEFFNCSGQDLPPGNAAYAVSQCGYPQFLVQGSSIAHPGSRPTEGHTLSVVGGSISIAEGAQPVPGASVAVQLWPPLVIDSQIVASNVGGNATVERRAALAVFPGNTLAFIVGVGDMFSFAAAIQALGATFAGYTDGGGSAALVPGPSGTRPVPTWLIVRGGGGMGPILGALIVTGIAAGILYATLRIKPRANPTAIQDDLGIRTTEDAIRYVERQSEPKGWPGDVEIVTIPFADRIRTIHTEKDRSVYPIRRIPIRSLRITQPVVDRALTIQLLREGWSEPILVSSRGEILDGHHRAYAASLRGDPSILARVVPVVRANPDVEFKSVSDRPEKWEGLTGAWQKRRARLKTKHVGSYVLHHEEFSATDGEITATDSASNVVGVLFYGKEHTSSKSLKGAVEVDPKHRRRHLATEMYVWAEALTGMNFEPDEPHTPYAKALWSQSQRPFGAKHNPARRRASK